MTLKSGRQSHRVHERRRRLIASGLACGYVPYTTLKKAMEVAGI